MSESTHRITGLPHPDGLVDKTINIPYVPGIPRRINIATMSKSTDPEMQKQWTLFILALEKLNNKSIFDKLSDFQVAGIVC